MPLLVSSILIILALFKPIRVLTFPKIPGLWGKSIDKVELYFLVFWFFSENRPCQCFLIDARALPVLREDNHCEEAQTFLEVIIEIMSPFLSEVCNGESLPFISHPTAVSPIFV